MGGDEPDILLRLAQSRGAEAVLVALVLTAARPLAFVFVLPLFTRFGLQQGLVRSGVLVAFAAPVLPGVAGQLLAIEPFGVPTLTMLLVKEMLIGLILGLILGLPLWALAAAGDIIDMQRGASMATLVDPGSGDDATVTGTLFFLLAALVLVQAGWFTEVLLTALYASYGGWPVLASLPALEPLAAEGVLAMLDALLETGLVLALPILAPLLIAEVALALAGKYTQQLNVMFLAMSLKQVIYCILLPIYFGALVFYVQDEVAALGDAQGTLRGFLDPTGALEDAR